MRTETVGASVRAVCAVRGCGAARDVYLTVVPESPETPPGAAWDAVASLLAEHGAHIVEERVFVAPGALPAARAARARSLGARDDGVAPAWLEVPRGAAGDLAGVLVHAVAGGAAPGILRAGGRAAGRRWRLGGYTLLTGSGIAGAGDDPAAAAGNMFAAAEELLAAAGAGLRQVSRTWLWLRGILDWYDDFNRVRNALFQARGLWGAEDAHPLPASTGIGIGPAGGGCCAMDFAADLSAAPGRILQHTGRQNPATRYGSAFSRGLVAETPFGRKVYVSGTASIGPDGRTLFAGDARAQIAETMRCVRAVLAAGGASESDVVQAIAYCKTPEVERMFRAEFASPALPVLAAVADVCRPELEFELECAAVAAPGTGGGGHA